MKGNFIEFKMNNDGSIRCNVSNNGKYMIINNQDKCRNLFKIAYKKNFVHKEVGNVVIFENVQEIMEIYDRIIKKKRV